MAHTHDLLQEQKDSMGKLMQSNNEVMSAFQSFHSAVGKDGALSGKVKELIALALAIKGECEWCIAIHVKKCFELGVTREEIIEAGLVAALMGGGPSLMYMQKVQQAIEELSSSGA